MFFFKRSILGLALVGALAAPASATQVCYFGECGAAPSTPSTAVPALRIPATFGAWQVLIDKDGHRMISDSFDDGSNLVIGQENNAFEFVFANKDWDFPANGKAEAKIIVDGRAFVGTATVVSSQMVALKDVSLTVVKAMYHGEKATITIGIHSWTLSLPDAARAIDAINTMTRVAW